MKKTIVIGITSSIAAFKAITLITLLKEKKYDVYAAMTPQAAQMIPVEEFEKITGHTVSVDLFPKDFDYKQILESRVVDHISLAKMADVFVVVPATANTIAKLAYGIADNFLTTSILATKAPVILCPAMNTNMWTNPITQHNLSLLRTYHYTIVEPTSGMLACGDEGKGKLENIPTILEEIEEVLANKNSLAGKKILVTAGATKEKIDDVRYITNRSSGKMGRALAEEAFLQGADVVLLRSNTAVTPFSPVREYVFESPEDLRTLLQEQVKNFDYIFHTTAVGDFQVTNYHKGKLESNKEITLVLSPQEKLIAFIKKINPNIHLFGFKAEYSMREKELVQHALRKLKEARADAIIANDVGKKESGFAADSNEVYIVFPDGKYSHIPYASKKEIAQKILQVVFLHKA